MVLVLIQKKVVSSPFMPVNVGQSLVALLHLNFGTGNFALVYYCLASWLALSLYLHADASGSLVWLLKFSTLPPYGWYYFKGFFTRYIYLIVIYIFNSYICVSLVLL